MSNLLEWFPEARILILRRDPRAMVASQLHTPWVRNHLTPFSLRRGVLAGKRLLVVAGQANGWSRIYEKRMPRWAGDPRVLVVAYEELVRNVAGEMQSICDFLEERFEPSMLTRRTAMTVPAPAAMAANSHDPWREWRVAHHAQTLRPVSATSIDKWRTELSKTETAMIEGRCRRGMRAAGYVPSRPPHQRSLGAALSQAVRTIGGWETRARARVKPLMLPLRDLVRGCIR